jgi:hypothetical protein
LKRHAEGTSLAYAKKEKPQPPVSATESQMMEFKKALDTLSQKKDEKKEEKRDEKKEEDDKKTGENTVHGKIMLYFQENCCYQWSY